MIVEPKVRSFICTTSHANGCMENVKRQIDYIKQSGPKKGPKNVLIIGASTGYGLASRITAAYGCNASTIGVMYEKPATEKRCATAGWYNTWAFETCAHKDGLYAKSINGDAFSKEIKNQTIELIKKDLGTVDMVIYSLASPRRAMEDGTTFTSVLKTVKGDFTNKSLDLRDNTIGEATITPATAEEIEATVKVMGGEDWFDWIDALVEANAIEENAITLAYSYIGPKLTYPVYNEGTIGKAKEHLYNTSIDITKKYNNLGLKAYISVNKALVTQSSSAIPIVPLYMAILYKVMKEQNLHEGCIEQVERLFSDKLKNIETSLDSLGRIRLDDWEMKDNIQEMVMENWNKVTAKNLNDYADITGYWDDFYHMFGFHFDNVDYSQDIDIQKFIPSVLADIN